MFNSLVLLNFSPFVYIYIYLILYFLSSIYLFGVYVDLVIVVVRFDSSFSFTFLLN